MIMSNSVSKNSGALQEHTVEIEMKSRYLEI